MKLYSMYVLLFGMAFSTQHNIVKFIHVALCVDHSFLLLRSSPWIDCTTIYLSIHLLMDI